MVFHPLVYAHKCWFLMTLLKVSVMLVDQHEWTIHPDCTRKCEFVFWLY